MIYPSCSLSLFIFDLYAYFPSRLSFVIFDHMSSTPPRKMLFMGVTLRGSVKLAHSELFFFRYLIFSWLECFHFSCSRKPPSEWPIQYVGANSRKLDKQYVLPKKAVLLLTNLRLLNPPRRIVSQARLITFRSLLFPFVLALARA